MHHETQGETTTIDDASLVDMKQLVKRLIDSDELKQAWDQIGTSFAENEVAATDLDDTAQLVERLLESDELRAVWEMPLRAVGAEAIRVSES